MSGYAGLDETANFRASIAPAGRRMVSPRRYVRRAYDPLGMEGEIHLTPPIFPIRKPEERSLNFRNFQVNGQAPVPDPRSEGNPGDTPNVPCYR